MWHPKDYIEVLHMKDLWRIVLLREKPKKTPLKETERLWIRSGVT